MGLRNNYGDPDIGPCWESLPSLGGNHLRVRCQNGPEAHTDALSLEYVSQRVPSPFGADCGLSVWIVVFLRKRRDAVYIFALRSLAHYLPERL